MAVATMNVSLTQQQAEMIGAEVQAGRYTSASEFVRGLVREWEQRQIKKDLAELERAHAGAWDRDTTPEEEAAILRAKRKARSKIQARQNRGARR
jgi:putative addiction module CopG family antidote